MSQLLLRHLAVALQTHVKNVLRPPVRLGGLLDDGVRQRVVADQLNLRDDLFAEVVEAVGMAFRRRDSTDLLD